VEQRGLTAPSDLGRVAITPEVRVAYEVARPTGLNVASVVVHVQDVKTSA
jgi:uncharacterized alkaline shock family protein YloU